MDELYCNQIGTYGFEEKIVTVVSPCRPNLKFVMSSSGFAKHGQELYKNACRTYSTITFPLLTNNVTVAIVVAQTP